MGHPRRLALLSSSARGRCGHEPGSGHLRAVWQRRSGRTPIPGAQALIERDGGVPFPGRRRDDPAAAASGTIPGGFVESSSIRSTRSGASCARKPASRSRPTEFLGPLDAAVRQAQRAVAHLAGCAVGGEERAGDDLTGAALVRARRAARRGRAGVRDLRRDPVTLARAAASTRRRARLDPERESGLQLHRLAIDGGAEPRQTASRSRGSVQLRSSQVMRRKPCGM